MAKTAFVLLFYLSLIHLFQPGWTTKENRIQGIEDSIVQNYANIVYDDTRVTDAQRKNQGTPHLDNAVSQTGNAQSIVRQVCSLALDLVIILDSSYTMEGEAWDEEKRTAYALIDSLDVSQNNTHVAVIVFGTNAVISIPLNGYRNADELKGKIGSLQYMSGWSRTDQALLAAKYQVLTPNGGSRPGIPKAVVVFTDGKTDGPSDQLVSELDWKAKVASASKEVQKDGTSVLCIGSDSTDPSQLAVIASKPVYVFRAKDINTVVDTLKKMSKEVCYEEKVPGPQPTTCPIPGCGFPSICVIAIQPTCLPPTQTTCVAPNTCSVTSSSCVAPNTCSVTSSSCVTPNTCSVTSSSCVTPGVCTATQTLTATSTALVTTTSTDVQTSTAVTTLSSTEILTSTSTETSTHTTTSTDTTTQTETATSTDIQTTTSTDVTTQTYHTTQTNTAVTTSTAIDTTTHTLSTTNIDTLTSTLVTIATSTALATKYVTNTLVTTLTDVDTSTHITTETLTKTDVTTATDTSTAVTTATKTATLTTTSTALTTSTHVTTDVSTQLTTQTVTDTTTHTTTHTSTDVATKTSTSVVAVTDTKTLVTTATETATATSTAIATSFIVATSTKLFTSTETLKSTHIDTSTKTHVTTATETATTTSTAIKTSFAIATSTSMLTSTKVLQSTQIDTSTKTHVTTAIITATKTTTSTATSTAVTTETNTQTKTQTLTTTSTEINTKTQTETATSTIMSTKVVTSCSMNCSSVTPPSRAGCHNKAIDVGLVIDAYQGFTDDVFTGLKNFVSELVSQFTVSLNFTHFSLITFGSSAVKQVYFNNIDFYNSAKLQKKIQDLPRVQGGGHWTDDAISLADSMFKEDAGRRPMNPGALVVFTADKTNPGSTPYPTAIAPLVNRGINIISVGVTDLVPNDELSAIANGKKDSVFSIKDYGSLWAMMSGLTEKICNTILSSIKDPIPGGSLICSANYTKLGCYNEKRSDPIMPVVILKSVPNSDNFAVWLKDFVCECAKSAEKMNYQVFGVTDSGTCYSSSLAIGNSNFYEEYGGSTKCYNGKKKPCKDSTPDECIGNPETIYVYGPPSLKPKPPKPCEIVVDLGFVLDGSGSISAGNFTKCKDFVKNMTKQFNVSQTDSHIGVVLFSTSASLVFNFKQYYDIPSIETAVDNIIQPKRYTNIAGALDKAYTDLFLSSQRPEKERILIFMTDGYSTYGDPNSIGPNAKKIKDEGIHIITLGIGNNYNLDELKLIASGSSYIFTADFNELDQVVQLIKEKACQAVYVDPEKEKAYFTIKPENTIYVRVGMTGKLVWKYEVTDKINTFKQYSPIWYVYNEDGTSKELASEDKQNNWSWSESSECPENYKGRISKEDQATLVISSIALTDSATYGCSLNVADGVPITSKVKLIAYDAKFTKTPESVVYVTAGHDARLEWVYKVDGGRENAFSAYSPTWSLYQQGQDVEIASENKTNNWAWSVSGTCPESLRARLKKESLATLVISKVTQADSGFYTCKLIMMSGEPVVSRIQLIVQEMISIEVKFTKVPPAEVSVTAGQSVSLQWEYTIINGDRNQAFKQYSPTWDLYYSPTEIKQLAAEDKSKNWAWDVSPTCPVALRERISKYSSANLVISNVKVSDSGMYGCTLNLVTGDTLTEKVNLIVKEPIPCQATIDLVFVLDLTSSEEHFQHVKKFAKTVAREFKVSQSDTHIGLLVFSMEHHVIFNLKKYYNIVDVENAIDQIQYSKFETDGNKIEDAIYGAKRDIFDTTGREHPSVVILVTDGKDNDLNVEEVKGYQLSIYTVGIGMSVNVGQLEGIASSSENVFNAGSYSDLGTVAKNVKAKVCADFTVGPTQPPTQPPIIPCKTTLDIAFLIDGSGSISTSNFNLCRQFIKDMVAHYEVSSDGSHVGAAQFANVAELVFGLDKYNSTELVNKAIDDMKKLTGGTFIGRGLDLVKDKLFGAVQARPNVPRILIVLTDGESENGDDLATPSTALKDQNITIFSLGIGDKVNGTQLNTIASDPDEDHVFKTGFNQLLKVVELIEAKACPDKKLAAEKEAKASVSWGEDHIHL